LQAVTLGGSGEFAGHEFVRYHYDEQGQLIATERAGQLWRQYAWRTGVLVGYRKAADGQRYYAQYDEYAAHGRVVRSWCADGPGDDRFTYDLARRRVSLTDALGRTTTIEYDQRFDVVATHHPDGRSTHTPFDTQGNP